MRQRDAFLELLSPALASAERERRNRTKATGARPVPRPEEIRRTPEGRRR